MRRRLVRFAGVALVPTAVDIALLVLLHRQFELGLVPADLGAIAAASAVSYWMHRRVTFRSDPYVRWVRMPAVFAVVASSAALVDTAVLVGVAGDQPVAAARLVGSKVGDIGTAAVVRWFAYRMVLLRSVRRTEASRRPAPEIAAPFDVSIVVPAFDEGDRIATTIDRLRTAALGRAVLLEIVVVDDGSTDDTADAALAAGADQVIIQPDNRGKGAAVRSGALAARGRVVAFTDADLAYAPAQVLELAAQVDDGWDVVVGDRRHPESGGPVGSSRLRSFGSRAINLLSYAVLLGSYRDTQCGLKAFRRDVAHSVFGRCRLDGFAFDIEVLHLLERDGASLLAMPVTVVHSPRSTVRAARDGLRLMRDLFRVRHWSAVGAYEPAGRAPEDIDGILSGPHG